MSENLKTNCASNPNPIYQKRPNTCLSKKKRPVGAHERQWKPIYKKSVALFAELAFVSVEKRKANAIKILENFKEIERFWYMENNGMALEEVAEEQENDPARVMRRIATLRTYASKAKAAGKTDKEANIKAEIDKLIQWLSLNQIK